MPIPAIASALIASAGGVVNLLAANQQKKRADEAERRTNSLMTNRPVYERPQEVNQAVGLARSRVGDRRMPGAERARRDAQLGAVNTAAIAGRGGDPFGAALAAQAQAENTNRQVAVQEADYRIRQEQNFGQALSMAAGYSDQEFQMNEQAPFIDELTRATNDFRDYREGANRNLGLGMEAISTVGLGLLAGRGTGSGDSSSISAEALAAFINKYGKQTSTE